MESQRPWHQLFGLSLIDFFRGQPITVELEKDLSLKQQLLDVVILRKDAAPQRTLPNSIRRIASRPHQRSALKSVVMDA